MRAIDADALIKRYQEHKRLFCKNQIEFHILSDKDKARVDELDNCIADVINMPTIEPEQTGQWINRQKVYTDLSIATCSNCGMRLAVGNYCLNCGIYMKE